MIPKQEEVSSGLSDVQVCLVSAVTPQAGRSPAGEVTATLHTDTMLLLPLM